MARQWQNLGVEAATYGSISMYTYIYTHTHDNVHVHLYIIIYNYIYIRIYIYTTRSYLLDSRYVLTSSFFLLILSLIVTLHRETSVPVEKALKT